MIGLTCEFSKQDDDEDDLSIFPTFKPEVVECDASKLNLTDLCAVTCDKSIEDFKEQFKNVEKAKETKTNFDAHGVFFYYKGFVNKFLEIIKIDVSFS